jgi:hypothetical protein
MSTKFGRRWREQRCSRILQNLEEYFKRQIVRAKYFLIFILGIEKLETRRTLLKKAVQVPSCILHRVDQWLGSPNNKLELKFHSCAVNRIEVSNSRIGLVLDAPEVSSCTATFF